MGSNKAIILAIATVFFGAGLWAGCTVGFDPNQDGVFPCQTNDDCIQGYKCSDDNQTCQKIQVGHVDHPPCDQTGNPPGDIDLDNDGYGTGSDRSQCPLDKRGKEDCNDNDPDVNPGQAELCDGKDNNCDDKIDNFDCPGGDVTLCGVQPPGELGSYLTYECQNETCVMVPKVRMSQTCQDIVISCDTTAQSFTYDSGGQTYNVGPGSTDEGPVKDCR